MASKIDEYGALRAEISAGEIGACYILYGEERYLLEHCVSEIREKLLPGGDGGFNHHRYGSAPDIETLSEAVFTFPFFAERTLVEISDFDFSSGLNALMPVLRDLPEHVCVLFICGAEFKLDKRLSAAKELLKLARAVEFKLQDRARLVPWILRHFAGLGRSVSAADAEYLAFITGGLMSPLRLEIEKLCAHREEAGAPVTREEIDKLVTPVPDAVAYRLTDAVAERDFKKAAHVLSDLFAMREPPHKLIYALTSKMRALLLARHYLDSGRGAGELMRLSGIRYEFQARNLMSAAGRWDIPHCTASVLLCAETAFRLNDGGGAESVTELLARLAALNA
ncbi:MAG: DNA polymerase III subunit delta [Clostridiales bacterium]|nr:DNA polymerase III subunit delta [Clostridiales bacterium]